LVSRAGCGLSLVVLLPKTEDVSVTGKASDQGYPELWLSLDACQAKVNGNELGIG
jgi:hypothetical protein